MSLAAFEFEIILQRIADGETVTKILREMKHNKFAAHKYIAGNAHRSERYLHAMDLHCDALFDKIVEISTNERDVMYARQQIDVLKFRIARLRPDRYNEKLRIDHDHEHKGGVTFNVVSTFPEVGNSAVTIEHSNNPV